jgi:hypothetical protein
MLKTNEPPAPPAASWKLQLLVGLVALTAGAAILAVAAGVIRVPASSLHAPLWVIAAAGLVFIFGGLSAVAPLAITSAVAASEQTRAQRKSIKLIQHLLACLMLSSFAAIACWVGFGPGDREFTATTNFGAVERTSPASETTGRFVFGGMGLLVGVWAAYAWFLFMRTLANLSRDDENSQP